MKHNKLFAMLAVAAALAVSACSGNGGSASSSAHKHTAAPDAPWQHDNNNHWKDCEANDGGKAENAKHTFGDPTDVVPATCTATGSQKVKCTVCGAEVTQTLPMIDHAWGEWEVISAATCTEAGSQKHVCSVCQTEETETIAATGHQWGEWETITEATCDKAGSRKHVCSVCLTEETEEVEALGHQLKAIGGEQQAPDGEATVRLYECERCHLTYLGFSADEPSEASKPHLMKGDNDGMRFFGRPIGNAMALTADGTSVNQQNNECVYCSTETGDFFEYVFTLNAEQAETLKTARLYCDARPANYLSGDFWAYNRSADDWTPGYYIDGADDHVQKDATTGEVVMVKDHAQATKNDDGSWTEGVELETEVKMGARIEDYRYILYVDGQPVDFDPDTSVPVKGSQQNMQRAEYVLPYTFHLHEGKNTISLRMAGGYRSEFYNFIFRPYVEPTPVVVNESTLEIEVGKTAQITSAMEGLTYASSSNSIATVDATGLVTGVKAGEATITVSKEGNYKPAKVKVTVKEVAGTFQISGETGVIAPEGGAEWYVSGYSASASRLRNFKKDSTVTFTFDSAVAGKFNIIFNARGSNVTLADHITLKVNDADVAVQGSYNSANSGVDVLVGQADLKATGNTLVITTISENNPLNLHYIKFVPAEEAPAHEHAWTDGDKVAKTDTTSAYQLGECACGKKRVLIDVATDLNGKITKRGGKLPSNGATAKYVFPFSGAKAAKLWFKGTVDNAGNYNYSYYTGKNGGNSAVTLPDGKTNTTVKVNGTEVALPTASYSELGMTGTNEEGSAIFEVGAVNLIDGNNEITLTRNDSFGIQYYEIFFIYE